MTDSDKIKKPKWHKRRLGILSRDNFKCRICNNEDDTLHVHHINYYKDRDPWD